MDTRAETILMPSQICPKAHQDYIYQTSPKIHCAKEKKWSKLAFFENFFILERHARKRLLFARAREDFETPIRGSSPRDAHTHLVAVPVRAAHVHGLDVE